MTPPSTSTVDSTPIVASELFQTKPEVCAIVGKRDDQEDRHLVLSVNRHKPGATVQGWLLAVMDGHGGSEAADAAKKALPKAFTRAFRACHRDMRKAMLYTVQLLNEEPTVRYQLIAGTTLSMVFVPDGKTEMYIAHLGDSPILVFSENGEILFRTEEHNIVTNPEEVKRAEQRSMQRHGEDRILITEQVSKSGRHRPHYLKDSRMEDDFEGMYNEIMDQMEKVAEEMGVEYSLDQMQRDGRHLSALMRGKGIQNTAELGAFPFDAVLSREPDVTFLRLREDELPSYLLIGTDGILDLDPHAPLKEVEKQIVNLIANEGVSLKGLARRIGGDHAPDNTTMILHKIE